MIRTKNVLSAIPVWQNQPHWFHFLCLQVKGHKPLICRIHIFGHTLFKTKPRYYYFFEHQSLGVGRISNWSYCYELCVNITTNLTNISQYKAAKCSFEIRPFSLKQIQTQDQAQDKFDDLEWQSVLSKIHFIYRTYSALNILNLPPDFLVTAYIFGWRLIQWIAKISDFLACRCFSSYVHAATPTSLSCVALEGEKHLHEKPSLCRRDGCIPPLPASRCTAQSQPSPHQPPSCRRWSLLLIHPADKKQKSLSWANVSIFGVASAS